MIQCKYCGDLQEHPLLVGLDKNSTSNAIKVGSSGVTTGMGRHYLNCKRGPKHQEKVRGGMEKYFPTTYLKQATTKEVVLDKALNFFISGNIAFNQADNPYFRALMSKIRIDRAGVMPHSS
jgi:hypothetical protein